MVVVFESVLAVLVTCGDVHYLGEKDRDYDFAVLYDVDLRHDGITVHENRLVFACDTAVISIPRFLCLRIY